MTAVRYDLTIEANLRVDNCNCNGRCAQVRHPAMLLTCSLCNVHSMCCDICVPRAVTAVREYYLLVIPTRSRRTCMWTIAMVTGAASRCATSMLCCCSHFESQVASATSALYAAPMVVAANAVR